jgi:hypothetical protein
MNDHIFSNYLYAVNVTFTSLCVCMYVCMYVYMRMINYLLYTYTHIYMNTQYVYLPRSVGRLPTLYIHSHMHAHIIRMPTEICGTSDGNVDESYHSRTNLCMYVCMHVCMYVCMHLCMYVCTYVRMYVCMHVCMYVCMYVFIYACT